VEQEYLLDCLSFSFLSKYNKLRLKKQKDVKIFIKYSLIKCKSNL